MCVCVFVCIEVERLDTAPPESAILDQEQHCSSSTSMEFVRDVEYDFGQTVATETETQPAASTSPLPPFGAVMENIPRPGEGKAPSQRRQSQ